MATRAYNPFTAVFNLRDDERKRANEGFILRFGQKIYDREISPVHDKGIMSIFNDKPNQFTSWYVEVLAFLVNERLTNDKAT